MRVKEQNRYPFEADRFCPEARFSGLKLRRREANQQFTTSRLSSYSDKKAATKRGAEA